MIHISSNSALPIFEQIVLEIGRLIAYEILEPHDQLPSVRSLAKDLGINPNTVVKAYDVCEKQNLIYSKKGLGFFVKAEQKGLNSLLDNAYQELNQSVDSIMQLGDTVEDITHYIKEAFK